MASHSAAHAHADTQTQVNSCPIALHQVKSLLSQLLTGALGSIRFEKVLHLTLVYLLSACYDDVWYAFLCLLWHPSVLQVTAQGTKTRVVMSRGDILMATLKTETVLCFIRRFKQMLHLILAVSLQAMLTTH